MFSLYCFLLLQTAFLLFRHKYNWMKTNSLFLGHKLYLFHSLNARTFFYNFTVGFRCCFRNCLLIGMYVRSCTRRSGKLKRLVSSIRRILSDSKIMSTLCKVNIFIYFVYFCGTVPVGVTSPQLISRAVIQIVANACHV